MVVTLNTTDDQNVIGIILGKESEEVIGMEGSISTMVSGVLKSVNPDNPIYIRVSRCAVPESKVFRDAKNYGLAAGMVVKKLDQVPPEYRTKAVKVSDMEPKETGEPSAPAVEEKLGKCQYCDSVTTLLDIPGFNVCKSCAQIELGRRLEKKG